MYNTCIYAYKQCSKVNIKWLIIFGFQKQFLFFERLCSKYLNSGGWIVNKLLFIVLTIKSFFLNLSTCILVLKSGHFPISLYRTLLDLFLKKINKSKNFLNSIILQTDC